jgi:hypothetical protein
VVISSHCGTSSVGEGTIPTIGDPDVMSGTTIGDPDERTIPTMGRVTKLQAIVIIEEYTYYQLHAKFYPISSQG